MIRNNFKKSCQYNIIKYIITDCTIDGLFTNNTMYNMNTCTITCNLFANNVIDSFSLSTINTTFNFTNNEMQTFTLNTVLNAFTNNVFALSIANCIFNYSADSNRGLAMAWVNTSASVLKQFRFNNIDCIYTGTVAVPIDLSAATHVYGNYTCKIYKNINGAYKISYYNASDAEVSFPVTT
jgi:hypothetical protein